jgi:rRNA maturation protein Nop10
MMFKINVMWDQETRAVGWYDLRQECIECGTITTAPTPIDEGFDCA